MILEISAAEYKKRTDMVTEEMKQRKADAFIFWSTTNVLYLTGFSFIPTERPVCMILDKDGSKTMFVPRLEVEHALECAGVDDAVSYPDYPGEVHPMQSVAEFLRSKKYHAGSLLSDAAGYSSSWGYVGPTLAEVMPEANLTIVKGILEKARLVKSCDEIEIIRQSCVWGNLAHTLLQEYSMPGATENEITMRASLDATLAMIKTLGNKYKPMSTSRVGTSANAWFRGQIGPNGAKPHAITTNAVLKPGDVLVTGARALVGGYYSELERTMFVGEPDAEQKRLFYLMKEAQDIAFENIRPGRKCSDVDRAVTAFFEKNNIMEYWRHHTGHGMGIQAHEAPFLDVGDDTVIQPGMILSVEPGLYVPGIGGFRHSDTVLVTETGIECLTYYPRDLESLICG